MPGDPMVGLVIQIRYSALRQQFGPPESPEVAILDYQSQQQKLIPALATVYAYGPPCAHCPAL